MNIDVHPHIVDKNISTIWFRHWGLRQKSQNPQLTDDIIDYSMHALVERGLIHSGEAAVGGIGNMTEQRWQQIYEQMTDMGAIEKGDYWRSAFDLSLLGSGLAMPPR